MIGRSFAVLRSSGWKAGRSIRYSGRMRGRLLERGFSRRDFAAKLDVSPANSIQCWRSNPRLTERHTRTSIPAISSNSRHVRRDGCNLGQDRIRARRSEGLGLRVLDAHGFEAETSLRQPYHRHTGRNRRGRARSPRKSIALKQALIDRASNRHSEPR